MSNFYKKTDLKVIKTDGGNVLHGYLEKNLDRIDVKEVYFSTIKKSQFRGWKMHKKMTLNLIVPIGEVRVHLVKEDSSKQGFARDEVILSQSPYFRLTVNPGIWFAFEGLSSTDSLICNIANLAHDPKEVSRRDYNSFFN